MLISGEVAEKEKEPYLPIFFISRLSLREAARESQ